MAIAAAIPMAQTCIDELGRLLGSQSFLAGESLSIADLMLAPQLDFFQATREGKTLLDGTNLADWLARMNQRPSMQRTQRPENLCAAARPLLGPYFSQRSYGSETAVTPG
jgi:glutathione S-transferase